jgi:transcriptional regulator with XRE-family HTH domain
MTIMRQVGHNIRRARLAAKLSQEALAHEAEVAPNYLSGIERGSRNPTVQVMDRLAKVLRVPVAELFAPVSGKEALGRNLKPGRRTKKP